MRRRRLRLAVVLAFAGLLAVTVWWASAAADDEESWLTVERGSLVLGVEVGGVLESVRSDRVGPPVISGMWSFELAWMAPEGSLVEAGDRVLAFNPEQLRQRLDRGISDRDSAAAELEKKQIELDRSRRDDELAVAESEAALRKAELQTDVPEELLGAVELQQARLDLRLAQAEVEHRRQRLVVQAARSQAEFSALRENRDRAAARVEEIRQSIQKMVVVSPAGGTVIYVSSPRSGEKKKVGDSVWQLERVVEIPDLTQMRAQGEVDEADAGRIAVGQRVTLRLDAHSDRLYTGKVAAIGETVQRRSRSRRGKVMRLEIALDGTDPERMRPGMRFAGDVEIERVDDAVLAPAEAIFGTAAGAVAFRRGRLGLSAVRPEIGRRNEEWVEVISGLSVGDRLAERPPEGWSPEEGRATEPGPAR